MGVKIRTGAPSWAKLVGVACRLSHTSGFWPAITRMIGAGPSSDLKLVWDPFCVAFEAVLANDDWPFQVDATAGEEEDRPPA